MIKGVKRGTVNEGVKKGAGVRSREEVEVARVCMWRGVARNSRAGGAITPTYYSLYTPDVLPSTN